MKRFTYRDLRAVMDRAEERLLEMPPRVSLPGMQRALTEHERLVVAYIAGAYDASGASVQVEYEAADSAVVD